METTHSYFEQLRGISEDYVAALANTQFYLELILVGVAIAFAALLSSLIRRQAKWAWEHHPNHSLTFAYAMKGLPLLLPFLSLLALSAVKPMVEKYTGMGAFTAALIPLSMAWLMMRLAAILVPTRAIALLISTLIFVVAILNVSGAMVSTTAYLHSLSFEVGSFKLSVLSLIQGVVIFVLLVWAAGLVSRAFDNYLIRHSSMSYNVRVLLSKFFKLFIYFTAMLVTLSAFGVDLTALAVFGGALGVGIGLGLQKITANFVSGIIILFEKSIKLGDLIEVANYSGWVRALNMRYTLIETLDGRELMVPNEELITTRVTNWTFNSDNARLDIKLVIPYAADVHLAQKIMLEAATAHPRCLKHPEAMCFVSEFTDLGTQLLLNFWIPDVKQGRRLPQSEVMLTIIEKFKAAGIAFAEKR